MFSLIAVGENMDKKRLVGIILVVVFILAFVAWNLQGPVTNPDDETAFFMRSFVGGLLAGGAVLSWAILVRKRPAKKS
jgi:hypothetical protein